MIKTADKNYDLERLVKCFKCKVPSLVCFTPATAYDHHFLEKLKCDEHTVQIFDKGYSNYGAFKHFIEYKSGFVTRITENAKYEVTLNSLIPENNYSGVLSDEIIIVEVDKRNVKTKLKLGKIKYYDRDQKKLLSLLAIYLNLEPT